MKLRWGDLESQHQICYWAWTSTLGGNNQKYIAIFLLCQGLGLSCGKQCKRPMAGETVLVGLSWGDRHSLVALSCQTKIDGCLMADTQAIPVRQPEG